MISDYSISMELENDTVWKKSLPAREGILFPFPSGMDPQIRECLKERGIEKLYCHQAEMFEKGCAGENIVITTSTASGKTLSFLLPVLQRILEDPCTRAIFVYPTKALAADQYRAFLPWLKAFDKKVSAGVYDGDTSPSERSRIRRHANIILTNPEMLNGAFLPNHSRYGFDLLFANLRFVVIDELHTYRGAFGSHTANLFRRMWRICRYYHSSPQFFCSSATIANPVWLAETICSVPFCRISRDGSPAGEREFRALQPPVIKNEKNEVIGRTSAQSLAVKVIMTLLEEKHPFIAFAGSRRGVEILLKETRDKLSEAGFLSELSKNQIAGYRGGYTPVERKTIEKKMLTGELSGLIATNALELGIDIGALDSAVLVGFPKTRASFWQQSGRSGRGKQKSVNYLILENKALDQYIGISPSWLFQNESENAIIDPDNLLIELAHVRAAAAEMPLSMDDLAAFSDLGEIIPVLMDAGELKSLNGRFIWGGPSTPAGDYSLRNMDKTRFKLLAWPDKETFMQEGSFRNAPKTESTEITQMDEAQAYRELYPGAVYLHEGISYEVLKLDLESHTAYCVPFTGNYYTVPSGNVETRILHTIRERACKRSGLTFGDINVDELTTMFKKLQFHNHQNLGYVTLSLPLHKEYDTESLWISIPENVTQVFRSMLVRYEDTGVIMNNHFEGMAFAVKTAAMMTTMADDSDIGAIVSNNALIPDRNPDGTVSLYLYDHYAGGLGYAEKMYDCFEDILERAITLVKNCPCKDGCPACVGDYLLDKKVVLWGLTNLQEETSAPGSTKPLPIRRKPSVKKPFTLKTLTAKWESFCEAARKSGDSGGRMFGIVKKVEVKGAVIHLCVKDAFTAGWLSEKENKKMMENILRFHVESPEEIVIEIHVLEQETERTGLSDSKREKLVRHIRKEIHDDTE